MTTLETLRSTGSGDELPWRDPQVHLPPIAKISEVTETVDRRRIPSSNYLQQSCDL